MKRQWFTPLVLGAVVLAAVALTSDRTPATAEDAPGHVSQRSCKKCHFKTHRSWKKTAHAKAMDVLKPGEKADVKTKFKLDPQKDYTKDPSCLACHVTGYGLKGGYPAVKDAWSDDEVKLAKNNSGVGCESCHGAGEKYVPFKKENEAYKRAEVVALGLTTPVTADVCTKCHTAEGNPTASDGYTFDFEVMMKKAEAIHEHIKLKHEH